MARHQAVALVATLLAPIAVDACAADYANCLNDKCCNAESTCKKQNAFYAQCEPSHAPGGGGGSSWGGGPWDQCNPDAPEEKKGPADATLYCFAVATPNTAEPGMLAAQHVLKKGIFACDAYEIISNVSADVLFEGSEDTIAALKEHTHVVDDNMTAKLVGGHLANAPLFQKAWRKIMSLTQYEKYDWTMKLDIDAVLLPARLSWRLKDRPYQSIKWDPKLPNETLPFKAEYFLNSLKDHTGNNLHGPVELLSKGAMQLFEAGYERCQEKVNFQNYGELVVAEDFFLGRCLMRLGVPSVPAQTFPFMYDKYEYGSWAKESCGRVALEWNDYNPHTYTVYHDYKNITGWMRCYNETGAGCISEADKQKALKVAAKLWRGPKSKRDDILGVDATTKLTFYAKFADFRLQSVQASWIALAGVTTLSVSAISALGFFIRRRRAGGVARLTAVPISDADFLLEELADA